MGRGYLENMKQACSVPRASEFWARNHSLYSSDFAAFVKAELIGAGDSAGDDSTRET